MKIPESIYMLIFCLSIAYIPYAHAQQLPDKAFSPEIKQPAYAYGKGPWILLDEAHYNFHKTDGRFYAFVKTLEKDGYVVKANKSFFTEASLKNVRILVIANALHVSDTSDWVVPNPSAFTEAEISAVKKWVENGGALFFIADHMPFAGSGDQLAKAFGFRFRNGFATDSSQSLKAGNRREPDVFQFSDHTLTVHPVTSGRNASERVTKVSTFTGQGFLPPSDAVSLLTFKDSFVSIEPDTAWKFNTDTRRVSLKGYSQGAVLSVGKGRVAVFGEAAMFSAQLAGADRKPMGMNHPAAAQNPQFLLNLVHWLDRIL